jgi:hypothetical protein
MANLKVIHDKIYQSTAYLAVGFYPTIEEIVFFSYSNGENLETTRVNKYVVGMWKIKQLKN